MGNCSATLLLHKCASAYPHLQNRSPGRHCIKLKQRTYLTCFSGFPQCLAVSMFSLFVFRSQDSKLILIHPHGIQRSCSAVAQKYYCLPSKLASLTIITSISDCTLLLFLSSYCCNYLMYMYYLVIIKINRKNNLPKPSPGDIMLNSWLQLHCLLSLKPQKVWGPQLGTDSHYTGG